jgi:aspartate/methionine/tyrosine aminotransferase
VDGPTKEDLAWGFRIGFLTFASPALGAEQYAVLENKVTGGIRSLVSNSNRLAQSLLIRALQSASYRDEKAQTFRILAERYHEVKRILAKTAVPPGVRVLPFNSGYFMTIEIAEGSSEELRKRLLLDHGVGTIASGDRYLRIAFSSIDVEKLEDFFRILFRAVLHLRG